MKNRLEEIRKTKGYSYRDLSKLTGVDFSNISKFEKDESSISLDKLCDIANFLNVSLDYMLKRTEINLLNQSIPQEKVNNIISNQKTISKAKKEALSLLDELDDEDINKINRIAIMMLEEKDKLENEISKIRKA